jgi:hypothetical protein
MTTMLPHEAQAAYRMAFAQQSAERYRIRRRTGRTSTRPVADRADVVRADGPRGAVPATQPETRLVSGAAASSAFATGRG